MELRKDPITQTWIVQELTEPTPVPTDPCPLCPGQEAGCAPNIYEHPYGTRQWQVRVIPHLRPIYKIEGDAQRRAEGHYDRMRGLGAHEVIIESPDHELVLSRQSDEQVAQVIRAAVSRISDLKKDNRFRYVNFFRNQGRAGGQDFRHPHSQIAATPFIPRRVAYELQSARNHFRLKERCLFCDLLRQELMQQLRTVEWDDQFVAFCPFASRVPYETWLLPVNHSSAFEEDLSGWTRQVRFARFLKSVLQRIETVAGSYHLVLHTSPNLNAKYDKGTSFSTLADDYHWHFEILPMIPARSKSYNFKEVYYNPLLPETAAERLRSGGTREDNP
jgi:UDPglucose--hexose-1-phosphate uridylyltransferase